MLIGKSLTIAREKGIDLSRTIIVDSTHTLSRSNPTMPAIALQKQSKILRKTVYEMDASLKDHMPEKMNLLSEMMEDITDHYTVSVDPDARTGHKAEDSEFFGYMISKLKPLVANEGNYARNGFSYNKDAEMMVCPAGHMAISKKIVNYKEDARKYQNEVMAFSFSATKCRVCAHAEKCGYKRISRRW